MFLSNNNIVIAPANTGKDNINNQAVINTAHTNKGNLSNVNPGERIFIIVTTKFIAPYKDDIPAKCKLKIDKSTAAPKWNGLSDNGGYMVHPVPAPPANNPVTNNIKDGGNNQNPTLF